MKVYTVRKKNKRVEDFDKTKIWSALVSAVEDLKTVEKITDNLDEIVICVTALMQREFTQEIPVERIHDAVEEHLKRLCFTPNPNQHIWVNTLTRYRDFRKNKESAHKSVMNQLELHLASFPSYEGVSIPHIISMIDQKIDSMEDMSAVNEILIRIVNDSVPLHYSYSFLAADILYQEICKEVQLSNPHLSYSTFFDLAVSANLLSKEYDSRLYFDGDINDTRLPYGKYTYLSLITLYDRYLLRKDDKVIELPTWLWMRVANVSIKGTTVFSTEGNKQFEYNTILRAISNFDFLPSTPTLFNAGTMKPQLSSCYVNTCPDSLDGIFELYKDIAQLSKWAGGIGVDWTAVRAKGSKIVGTNGNSGGVIPYLKIMNDIAIAVNQGGKRKGAVAVYLENWHLDIEEFIDLRKNTGDERRRAHDIHPVVFISDLFMKRVNERGNWTLFCPQSVIGLRESYGEDFEKNYIHAENTVPENKKKVVPAFDLWKDMVTTLFTTGHPWITFKDAMNVRNPQGHVGMIHSSNLCTEIALNTSKQQTAVCNLASVNLANHVTAKLVDWEKLELTVKSAVRFLDAVIDENFYPTTAALESNMTNRPVGLGIMGLQDMFLMLELEWESDEATQLSSTIMEFISYHAINQSIEIARMQGKYSNFPGSFWSKGIFPIDTIDKLSKERGTIIKRWDTKQPAALDWEGTKLRAQQYGMRNSNLLAIAPTATIANIASVTPTHEPTFRNVYIKNNLSGTFLIFNKHLVDYFNRNIPGGWTKDVANFVLSSSGSIAGYKNKSVSQDVIDKMKSLFKTVWEIDQKKLLDGVAARTQWVDQAASTNLFIKNNKGKDLSDLYMYAWGLGLKTTYYMRTLNPNEIAKMNAVQCDITCNACE